MERKADPESRSEKNLGRQAREDKKHHHYRPDGADRQSDAKHADHPLTVLVKFSFYYHPPGYRQGDQEIKRKKGGGSRLVQTADRFYNKRQDKRGQADDIAADNYQASDLAVQFWMFSPETWEELQRTEEHKQGAGQDMDKGYCWVTNKVRVERRPHFACGVKRTNQSFDGERPPDNHYYADSGQQEHQGSYESVHGLKLGINPGMGGHVATIGPSV